MFADRDEDEWLERGGKRDGKYKNNLIIDDKEWLIEFLLFLLDLLYSFCLDINYFISKNIFILNPLHFNG